MIISSSYFTVVVYRPVLRTHVHELHLSWTSKSQLGLRPRVSGFLRHQTLNKSSHLLNHILRIGHSIMLKFFSPDRKWDNGRICTSTVKKNVYPNFSHLRLWGH